MKSLKKQIGGSYYRDMKFQPIEFIMANDLGFIPACIIKYACRYKNKNGVEDLEKIIHYAQLEIDNINKK